MPDELGRFETKGLTWAQRAVLGGLRAVIGPGLSQRKNLFLHGVHSYGAEHALELMPARAAVVDFGCGNGRFSRFFAEHGMTVLGTEITREMIEDAQKESHDDRCSFALTDGIHIPAKDASLDAIWCCGVLRFSLLVDEPVHDKIVAEMWRVLRPGGKVINLEVYVDREPSVFLRDFENAGFVVRERRVLHRYAGRLEKLVGNRFVPERAMAWIGRKVAQARYHLDDPGRTKSGLRDYYFVFEKPR